MEVFHGIGNLYTQHTTGVSHVPEVCTLRKTQVAVIQQHVTVMHAARCATPAVSCRGINTSKEYLAKEPMFCAVHGPTVSKCFANELGQYSITNDITCLSKSELYTLHMPMKVAVPSIVLVKLRLASRAHSVRCRCLPMFGWTSLESIRTSAENSCNCVSSDSEGTFG